MMKDDAKTKPSNNPGTHLSSPVAQVMGGAHLVIYFSTFFVCVRVRETRESFEAHSVLICQNRDSKAPTSVWKLAWWVVP